MLDGRPEEAARGELLPPLADLLAELGVGGSGGSGGSGDSAGSGGTGISGGGGSGGSGGTECGVSVYAGDYRTGVDDPSALEGASRITGSVEVIADDVPTLGCITAIAGDLTVTAFPNLDGLERLTSVGGDLTVRGAPADLEALKNLETVGGGVDIEDGSDVLTNLAGLRGLESIGGTLKVSAPALTSLGLDALSVVGGDFDVLLDALAVLDGPPELTSIEGSLFVSWAGDGVEWDLRTVQGFDSLSSVGGSVAIESGGALSVALPSLETIGADFNLRNRNSLAPPDEPSDLALGRLTQVGGALTISALTHADLAGLGGLTTIGGSLQLNHNSRLEQLAGLSSLTSVGGIQLNSNLSLRSLHGLEKLETVAGALGIVQTPLTDHEGLSSLTSIGTSLFIEDVPLDDLNGLRNLSTIGEGIEIQKTHLRDLTGLASLTEICAAAAGDGSCGVELWWNPLIASLDGLPPTPLIEVVWLFDNDSLTDLSALAATRGISHGLFVGFNAELASLAGLSGLEKVGAGVTFLDNPKLRTCEIHEFRLGIEYVEEPILIAGNDDLGTCDGS